jgi:hypothetical protein
MARENAAHEQREQREQREQQAPDWRATTGNDRGNTTGADGEEEA